MPATRHCRDECAVLTAAAARHGGDRCCLIVQLRQTHPRHPPQEIIMTPRQCVQRRLWGQIFVGVVRACGGCAIRLRVGLLLTEHNRTTAAHGPWAPWIRIGGSVLRLDSV